MTKKQKKSLQQILIALALVILLKLLLLSLIHILCYDSAFSS